MMDVVVSVDYRVKINERKKSQYLYLARELRKLLNTRVMMIPISIFEFGTVTKALERMMEKLEIEVL